MKYFYTALAGALLLFSGHAIAQCTATITASTNDSVCAGTNTTLTANVVGPGTALTTTFAAGNNHRGNMFDITAINTVTITSFDAHPMGNTTIEIYYRAGTWNGFANNPAAWTLVGSAPVTAQPTGNPTPVPVAVNITIPAGQTYGFYVTSTNTAVSLNYTDGSSVGNVYSSDANIQFREGGGMEYPFTAGTGSVFMPRIWNGIIHYSTGGTPSFLWNTSATTSSILETVSTSTTYSVAVTVAGCPTINATYNMTVSAPTVNAGSDFAVCTGQPATLTGSGNGAVSYTWDQGVTDNVAFTPTATQQYILQGTDYLGCSDWDTVTVTVNSLPAVNAGPDTSVCMGSMLALSGSGANSYSWTGGITDGIPFQVLNNTTYTVMGTDANGCSANDTVNVSIHVVDTSVTVLNETITANDSAASYQWIDCNTMQPIPGATGQSFTATQNGSYAVIITSAMCSDTSACETIISTGINTPYELFSVYPNPTNGVLVITTAAPVSRIEITSVTGQIVAAIQPTGNRVELNLSSEPGGVYFVTVYALSGSKSVSRVIKQ